MVSAVNAVLALPALRLVSWALPEASTEGIPTSSLARRLPMRASGRAACRRRPLGYWRPVSRSLRHPFRGQRRFLRPQRSQSQRRKPARQPRMRQSRFSMEAILDAPDTTESRPGLRIRVIASGGPRALLRPRASAVGAPGPPGTGSGQGGGGRPDPRGGRRPHPRADPRSLRQPARQQLGDRADHPVPGGGQAGPGRHRPVGRPHRRDLGAGQRDHQRPALQPLQAGPDPVGRPAARRALHPGAPVGVPRGDVGRHHPAELPAAGDPGAGAAGVSGRARSRFRGDDQLRRAQVAGQSRATRPATPSGSPGSSTSTSPSCGEPQASSSSRSTPRARWWAR